mmetsp:Transcript_25819/g.72008  ORF Transcript_25819/g.72008 Transcript_25819/m.72008 type:complete len:212 (-) Transcript_25819:1263-1898(-)
MAQDGLARARPSGTGTGRLASLHRARPGPGLPRPPLPAPSARADGLCARGEPAQAVRELRYPRSGRHRVAEPAAGDNARQGRRRRGGVRRFGGVHPAVLPLRAAAAGAAVHPTLLPLGGRQPRRAQGWRQGLLQADAQVAAAARQAERPGLHGVQGIWGHPSPAPPREYVQLGPLDSRGHAAAGLSHLACPAFLSLRQLRAVFPLLRAALL